MHRNLSHWLYNISVMKDSYNDMKSRPIELTCVGLSMACPNNLVVNEIIKSIAFLYVHTYIVYLLIIAFTIYIRSHVV